MPAAAAPPATPPVPPCPRPPPRRAAAARAAHSAPADPPAAGRPPPGRAPAPAACIPHQACEDASAHLDLGEGGAAALDIGLGHAAHVPLQVEPVAAFLLHRGDVEEAGRIERESDLDWPARLLARRDLDRAGGDFVVVAGLGRLDAARLFHPPDVGGLLVV